MMQGLGASCQSISVVQQRWSATHRGLLQRAHGVDEVEGEELLEAQDGAVVRLEHLVALAAELHRDVCDALLPAAAQGCSVISDWASMLHAVQQQGQPCVMSLAAQRCCSLVMTKLLRLVVMHCLVLLLPMLLRMKGTASQLGPTAAGSLAGRGQG